MAAEKQMHWFQVMRSSDFAELRLDGSNFVLVGLMTENRRALPHFTDFVEFREALWNSNYVEKLHGGCSRDLGPLVYEAGFSGLVDRSRDSWDRVLSSADPDAPVYLVLAEEKRKSVGLVGMRYDGDRVRYNRFWYFPRPLLQQSVSEDRRHGVEPYEVQEALCIWLRGRGCTKLWGGKVETKYGCSHYVKCRFEKKQEEWGKDL